MVCVDVVTVANTLVEVIAFVRTEFAVDVTVTGATGYALEQKLIAAG